MWNFNSGKWIRQVFPNQTQNIPTILVWALIYLLDVALVFFLGSLLDIPILAMSYQMLSFFVILYVLIAFVLFWAEARVWDHFRSNTNNAKE